ncbi:starch synthase [Prevotella aff. ruminicola Tc2-24]|uniref:starch synthase n=1 Tax=Prevotella aff. ruminicola Tc2-24 TaxID=81582 RepID=A0A1I0M4N4_9BACT|nr:MULTISPECIES: glycogen/starch synthase [Prevotella]SEE04117.1 starch synthase [Prevotella sp. lc2012]SEV83078.1 starch synthase [Prevotella aff. ruminicola Tc2-24]
MAKKKILFINQEISPYVPDNSLSLMGKDLPQAMQELNHEIRTFMPKWGTINERRGQLHEVIRLSGMNLIINDTDHPLIIKVASIQSARVQVYFIDNDDYFGKRLMEKDEQGEDYPDNGERAIFFARGVLETVKKLRWVPDIIHCQGWMSAVVPLYVKTAYHDEPSFAKTKVVTSLFSKSLEKDLGTNFKKCLEFREAKAELLKGYNDNFDINELVKLAIDYSDGVVQADEVVNKKLLDYAKGRNIPVLGYHRDFADEYEKFYAQLFPEEEQTVEED